MPCDPVHPNFFARRPQLTPQEIVSIQRLTRFSMKDEFVWLNAVRAKPCKSLARLATERDEPHTSLRFRRGLVKPRATPFCFAPACAKQVSRSRREVCGSSLSVARRARLLQGFARTAFSQTN